MHSASSMAQVEPVKPVAQSHWYDAMPSTHVPALAHGSDEQSSMFVSHAIPLKPGRHRHVHSLTACVKQVPSLAHGDEAHSSMSDSHWVPVNPEVQEHDGYATISVQVAPFEHGDEAH